jgi:hypothetical protein
MSLQKISMMRALNGAPFVGQQHAYSVLGFRAALRQPILEMVP